jgi:hypothetical protein
MVLIIAAAWTLKSGRGKAAAQEAQEQSQDTAAVAEPKKEDTTSEEEQEASAEDGDEEARAEREREAFVTDYDSYPLLETTPIRNLSMEVGATEDEIRFNWMSPSSRAGQVTWYTVQNGDFVTFAAECTPSTTTAGYYVNKATVTGLQPGYTYAYKVGNDEGGWSPEYQYTVPEDTGESLTFLVTSDVQIGQAQYDDVSVTVDTWDKVITRLTSYVPEAQFLFHLGDQVAVFGDSEQYGGFLNHLGLYKIPLAPVVGNHDVANDDTIEESGLPGGQYFYEHFNVPNRSQQYGISKYDKDGDYCFVRGDVLFIVLNCCANQAIDIHEEYVPQVIAEHPEAKWRVLVQHYPAYSSVAKYQERLDSWIRNSLAYIAEDNDIDLVLSGHDHVYSRSAFINRKCEVLEGYDYSSGGTAVNPEGTMYVTCGTSSGCLYQAVTAEEHLVFQEQPYVPTALKIDVNQEELHLTAYLMDSWSVYDEYTIRKE